jgi:RNA recognition motif-containing protein
MLNLYPFALGDIKMNIYVGNLSYDIKEEDLRSAFEQFGAVESVNIIKDKFSGRSKGFGFVEMPSRAEGQAAIDGLNGKEKDGRALKVNEARPRSEKPGDRRGFGGGKAKRGQSGGARSGRRPY